MPVQRWQAIAGQMRPHPGGAYVRWRDYQRVAQEMDRHLEAAREAGRESDQLRALLAERAEMFAALETEGSALREAVSEWNKLPEGMDKIDAGRRMVRRARGEGA